MNTKFLNKINASRGFFIVQATLLCALFAACNVNKHLNDAQGARFLTKNTLEMKAEEKLSFSKRTSLQYEMSGLFKVKPNERSLLLFGSRARLAVYYKYHDKDSSRLAEWMMRRIAEPPALYNDARTQETAVNFQNYLHQRGYFKARCTYETSFIGKYKATTTYQLEFGPLYTIESVEFMSPDSNIQRILLETAADSRLRPGGALDGRQFEAEKFRITNELKNRGYAFFIPNYVDFTGDSTGTLTKVTVEVLTENDSTLHKTYTIGDVAVFSSLVPDYSSIRRDTTIHGMYFASAESQFLIKPERLYSLIAVKPGTMYRQEDLDKTVRNLSSLGLFRFVSVKPLPDTITPDQLNIAVSFSPSKRLPIDGGIDFNSSNSSVSGRLFGVSAYVGARNRNLFHGAEQAQTNLQYNIEFDVSNRDRLLFSQEFKFSNDLTFPRFFDYFGLYKGLNAVNVGNWHLLPSPLYARMRTEAQTRVELSYNYLNLISYYSYNLFNSSFGYSLRANPERQFIFDNIGIDFLRPNTTPQFDSLFQENEFLKRSFGKQLFTGFLLRSLSYTSVGKPNVFGEHWYYRLNGELSGLEIYTLNKLWSAAFTDQTWRLADIDFSKYLRLDADISYTRDFSRNVTAAVRLGCGMVLPFGDTLDAPYVKQFFVGGPSSVRAWRIRELGPGSYHDPAPPVNQPFYQAANFRFEFNGELRFPLFWWLKGAVFVDGGNVWTFQEDPNRPGSKLQWNAYKDIALGTGFGFRGDFDYFVLRFDLGIKLRRPYPDDQGKYWEFGQFRHFQLRDLNPNLSVGYPF